MSEWISVEDRLPEPLFDWVIVYADGAMSTMGYTEEDGFYEPHPIKTNVDIEMITHWQDMPEPPK